MSSGSRSSAEPVLLDTSVALPFLNPGDEEFERLRSDLTDSELGLSGHAEFEVYSVLTRMPPPLRVTAAVASKLLAEVFPATRHLGAAAAAGLRGELAALGIAGGAVYDGLVAAAAREHGLTLLTKDRRAERTYRLLGVSYRML